MRGGNGVFDLLCSEASERTVLLADQGQIESKWLMFRGMDSVKYGGAE
jgi:hypothetical protein